MYIKARDQPIMLLLVMLCCSAYKFHLACYSVCSMLNKNTPGIKKVRGQSEAALQIGSYVRPKTLISVEAKKLRTYQKSF